MPAKVSLLIIDPQIDFCDVPDSAGLTVKPALPVPGAWDDMARLATMVDRLGSRLSDITVTLDSHHRVDIAHPLWWVDGNGKTVAPFTQIEAAEVEAGIYTTRNPRFRERSLAYLRQLETGGKFKLMVWPEHCLIGSLGAAIHPGLFQALNRWTASPLNLVDFVTKGSNIWTEHYSAVQAEVPDPADPGTMLNDNLIRSLQDADIILLAGEAKSHCLKSTVTDIADGIGEEHIRKFVLLSDCTSSIPAVPNGGPALDFPAIAERFVQDMVARGMKVATSTDFLA